MVQAETSTVKHPNIEAIAALCYNKYRSLPKTGKPTINEWTVLAAVVQHNALNDELKLVALGCGTKCLGGTQLCNKGLALNDAHAEVLARRAFCRYLYKQLTNANKKQSSIFTWLQAEHQYQLQPDVYFHFMSTQTPCGDACIIADEASISNANETDGVPAKRVRLETTKSCEQIYTGAKLIDSASADAMQQTIGAIRIKPGRGDRTLSVSCSDKLAKWTVLGAQGALLAAHLQTPIYFATMNFCCASDPRALERAIYKRWLHSTTNNEHFQPHVPQIRIAQALKFEFAESAIRVEPAAAGMAWCDVDQKQRPYEAVVKGIRQGITKKHLHTPHAALQISRYHFMRQYLQLLHEQPMLLLNLNDCSMQAVADMTYNQLKLLSCAYQAHWKMLKQSYFREWTVKPKEIKEFKLADADKPSG